MVARERTSEAAAIPSLEESTLAWMSAELARVALRVQEDVAVAVFAQMEEDRGELRAALARMSEDMERHQEFHKQLTALAQDLANTQGPMSRKAAIESSLAAASEDKAWQAATDTLRTEFKHELDRNRQELTAHRESTRGFIQEESLRVQREITVELEAEISKWNTRDAEVQLTLSNMEGQLFKASALWQGQQASYDQALQKLSLRLESVRSLVEATKPSGPVDHFPAATSSAGCAGTGELVCPLGTSAASEQLLLTSQRRVGAEAAGLSSAEGISNRLEALEATCTALCARFDGSGHFHTTPYSAQDRAGPTRVDVRLSSPTTAAGMRSTCMEVTVPEEPLPKNGSAHEPDDASHSAISSATVPPHCDLQQRQQQQQQHCRNYSHTGSPNLTGQHDVSMGSVMNAALIAAAEACVMQDPDRHGHSVRPVEAMCQLPRGSFRLEAAHPLSAVPSTTPRLSGVRTAPVAQATKVATPTMVQQTGCSLGGIQTAQNHSFQPTATSRGSQAWTSQRSVSPLQRTEPSTVRSPQLLQVESSRASGTTQVLRQPQQQQQQLQQHHPQPWGAAPAHLRTPPPPSVGSGGSLHAATTPVWVQTVQAPATRSCSPAQHVRRASSAGALVRPPLW